MARVKKFTKQVVTVQSGIHLEAILKRLARCHGSDIRLTFPKRVLGTFRHTETKLDTTFIYSDGCHVSPTFTYKGKVTVEKVYDDFFGKRTMTDTLVCHTLPALPTHPVLTKTTILHHNVYTGDCESSWLARYNQPLDEPQHEPYSNTSLGTLLPEGLNGKRGTFVIEVWFREDAHPACPCPSEWESGEYRGYDCHGGRDRWEDEENPVDPCPSIQGRI